MPISANEILHVAKEFDSAYYRSEYPDLIDEEDKLLLHFCALGWREGRNPNSFFDTVSYLLRYGDVVDERINPFFHFLRYGRPEGRTASPAVSPSVRTKLLFGYSVVDWVNQLNPHFDSAFYLSENRDLSLNGINPVAHFAYFGWRLGRSPTKSFDTKQWLLHNPSLGRFLVNPVIIQIEKARGRFDDRTITNLRPRQIKLQHGQGGQPELARHVENNPRAALAEPTINASDEVGLDPGALALVREAFSEPFYRAKYPDIAAAKIDPFRHYMQEGWKEGRNPNEEFDTSYYLAINDDVRKAGINPLLHFLTEGRQEGRQPCRPGGYRRSIIDAARPPETRTDHYTVEKNKRSLTLKQIHRILSGIPGTTSGFAVSISHDCYIKSVGGTQIFIADEQANFAKDKVAYLHVSPVQPRLVLVNEGESIDVRLILNGSLIGTCSLKTLANALKDCLPASLDKYFIIHSLFGFNSESVLMLNTLLCPTKSIFWLHDYSSLCAGFNLLRNNVQFCGAPPPESMTCRVCVYGRNRLSHLDQVQRIFVGLHPIVLAPSQITLDLWLRSSRLPHDKAAVVPHWTLCQTNKVEIRKLGKQISVAFVGYPLESKGWYQFQTVVTRLRSNPEFRFFHFATAGTTTSPDTAFVKTAVTAGDRSATVRLLREHAPDFVAVLSIWPETFSFVVHEALLAGCSILAFEDGGNVAAIAKETGYGKVFKSEEEIIQFLISGEARLFLKRLGIRRRRRDFSPSGTTANFLNGATRVIPLEKT